MLSGPVEGYAELRVQVTNEQLDVICDIIIEECASGLIIEEDPELPGQSDVIFYLPAIQASAAENSLRTHIASRFPDQGNAPITLSSRGVKAIEWEEAYRQSIQPIAIPPDLIVRPPWGASAGAGQIDIIIEPKMAFGTGHHETTRSCLTLIRTHFRGGTFLDIGTGSGVLAILAERLGASKLVCIDNDPDAVANCSENFVINGVTTRHRILEGTIDSCDSSENFDFVTANIIRSTILEILPRLIAKTQPGGQLLLSGLLFQDVGPIRDALRGSPMAERIIHADNEWRSILLERMP